MPNRDHFITAAEAHDIAMTAAEEGSTRSLKRTFALLGVDLDDFESVQEFRGDLQWVKSGRRVSKAITGRSLSSVVGVASIGVVVGFYDWFKTILSHFIK